MTIPSTLDIKKRKANLDKFLKNLDDDGIPQEKHMVSVVRSAIRSAWMKSNTKLAYLYMNTVPDMDDRTRTKWLVKCEICGGMFKLNDVEIDHKSGEHSFTKVDDFESYFRNILMIGFDDLQILCKADHATKTLMERQGLSWEDSVIEKKLISICKLKQDKLFLQNAGITPASTQAKRKIQVREVLKLESQCKGKDDEWGCREA